ncbi:hypothetical protein ANOM_002139 [Aspergillus nomiae NRRL 13137]|uniref:Aminotransferase class I/classII large domain-containing protein n=1 Tax=Aspergillus nomiae NRRL (strain ATCC 15546 / NRRL 13137 / CBS 260.88 / M93) TaxID=1509407 RepID=A0A0L1JBS1_ASPN3|nr:uncharacterized protein ANOM_002139 [Aspergillus nomiae NRRL 13137]KNG89221.1 hypothetical protein ANOM_002139 [Aspergillus nomiae NRRL 13137]
MSEFHREEHIDAAILQHHLSRRAAENFEHRDVWGPREKSMANPWSPENPDGTIILRLAENSLLHDEMGQLIKEQITVLPLSHLTYSTGPRGSRRLRRAAAAFLNEDFHSRQTITQDNIFITPGLASAVDALTWAICNDGDGILIPQPYYNGFGFDVLNRSNGQVIGVKYEGVEGFSGLDDLFRPDVNKRALEVALREAKKNGIAIRALIISNPHNPLGRCYPPETLLEFASFCGRNQLHFISDEIYAKSVFPNTAMPSPTPFVSTLSLDLRDVIDPTLMHVLYGASKDFCANGLRLGVVCTNNEGLIGAMSSISMFSWSPHVLQDVWAAMLEDRQRLEDFMLRKCELMAENYRIATSFFREHGISYYEMNAGLFIWVDLRHLLIPKSLRQQNDYSELRMTSPDASIYKQREQKFADICAQNGLMITPGSVYAAEEFGWFRLTFTVGKNALEEGLKRLEKSLSAAETDMQF